MATIAIETDWIDNMPSTQERLASVEERVKNHIHFFWAIIGVGFVWLGAISMQLYWINGDIKTISGSIKQANQLADLGNTASKSPKIALQQIASFDSKTFPKSLPVLKKITEATITQIKPRNQDLITIAEKLRGTNQESTDYWPTVMQFIQFASAVFHPNVPPPGSAGIYSSGSHISLRKMENIRILLDGGSLDDSDFTNCRIIFTEKPVSMRNVKFINCVFEMPNISSPSPYLKNTSKILLASNLSNVSIPSL